MLTDKAHRIIHATLKALSAQELIRRNVIVAGNRLRIGEEDYPLNRYRRLFILGAGKASAAMAVALEDMLGERITRGLVITKYGHSLPAKYVEIREAGHPVPDVQSLRHTNDLLELAKQASADDLVLFVLSGGASALLECPVEGISLEQLQLMNKLLLQSGAPISVLNRLRSRLSQVKGGKLLQQISPAHCITLAISDVPGDIPAFIGSGPTVLHPPVPNKPLSELLMTYKLDKNLPAAIIKRLKYPDLTTAQTRSFHSFHIIGNNQTALLQIEKSARANGFKTQLINSAVEGEAQTVAQKLMEQIRRNIVIGSPQCFIWGGETTVTFRQAGKGGRNQEMALAALIALKDFEMDYRAVFLGTDGTDGPTDAAGALIRPNVWKTANAKKLNPTEYIEKHDSYSFFAQTGGLIKTGPTGTNVMDVGFFLTGK